MGIMRPWCYIDNAKSNVENVIGEDHDDDIDDGYTFMQRMTIMELTMTMLLIMLLKLVS